MARPGANDLGRMEILNYYSLFRAEVEVQPATGFISTRVEEPKLKTQVMRKLLLLVSLTLLLTLRFSGVDQVQRPHILGVAHMALYVSDLERARGFYEDFLGYAEPYKLKRDDGSDRIAFVKINEDQYLELFAEPPMSEGHLNHIAFYTDSAEGLRSYLASQGIKVPDKVSKGKIGNLNFTVSDPDGHTVEFVQYEPDSWTRQQQGKVSACNPSFNSHHAYRCHHRAARAGDEVLSRHSRVSGILEGKLVVNGSELGKHANAQRQGLSRIHALLQASGSAATRREEPHLSGCAGHSESCGSAECTSRAKELLAANRN